MMRFIWDLLMFVIYGGLILIAVGLLLLFGWVWVGLLAKTTSWIERRWP